MRRYVTSWAIVTSAAWAIAGIAAGLLAQQPAPPAPEVAPGGVFRIPAAHEPPKDAPAAPKAEGPKQNLLVNEGKPIQIPFTCAETDMELYGMSCSEERPCPIFAEIAGVQPLGQKVFLTGNIHDGTSTMYSLLLASDDEGRTWTEPVDRVKGGGLDHIQFVDFETGWISGQLLGAFPRDPFFLLTTDGGKTWRKRPVFSEARISAIERFWFESRTAGSMIIDRMQGGETGSRYELHETMTGGESWMIRQISPKPVPLKGSRDTETQTGWRVRGDAATGANVIERKRGAGYSPVASFFVKVGDCSPAPAPLLEPPPPPEPAQAPPAGRRPAGPAAPPTLRKK